MRAMLASSDRISSCALLCAAVHAPRAVASAALVVVFAVANLRERVWCMVRDVDGGCVDAWMRKYVNAGDC